MGFMETAKVQHLFTSAVRECIYRKELLVELWLPLPEGTVFVSLLQCDLVDSARNYNLSVLRETS